MSFCCPLSWQLIITFKAISSQLINHTFELPSCSKVQKWPFPHSFFSLVYFCSWFYSVFTLFGAVHIHCTAKIFWLEIYIHFVIMPSAIIENLNLLIKFWWIIFGYGDSTIHMMSTFSEIIFRKLTIMCAFLTLVSDLRMINSNEALARGTWKSTQVPEMLKFYRWYFMMVVLIIGIQNKANSINNIRKTEPESKNRKKRDMEKIWPERP